MTKYSRSELYAMRKKHGLTEAIGLTCSKLIEQMDNLAHTPESQPNARSNLTKSIEFSERDLGRMLADLQ